MIFLQIYRKYANNQRKYFIFFTSLIMLFYLIKSAERLIEQFICLLMTLECIIWPLYYNI